MTQRLERAIAPWLALSVDEGTPIYRVPTREVKEKKPFITYQFLDWQRVTDPRPQFRGGKQIIETIWQSSLEINGYGKRSLEFLFRMSDLLSDHSIRESFHEKKVTVTFGGRISDQTALVESTYEARYQSAWLVSYIRRTEYESDVQNIASVSLDCES